MFGSAFLSLLVKQYKDAFSIAAAIIIVGTVGFIQEYRSEKSLEALKTLVPLRCNVIRSAQTMNILAEELVPGDIIRLSSGDRVPADGRLVASTDLFVDESSLTGEPEPREKNSNAIPDIADDSTISDRHNIVFLGSLVCTGNGLAVVIATGAHTEFGKTYQEMKDVETKRTPLQVKMDDLGQQISMFSIGIIVCICIIGSIQGKSILSMFNIGVSLAVAAIPEGLPICVTVTLALGVMRMVSKNAIVKKLPAVEALGCANFICSDKTGTLTENRMTVQQLYCPVMDDIVYLDGISETNGSKLSSLSLNTESKARLTYNGHLIDTDQYPCIVQLFEIGNLCNNAQMIDSDIIGPPLEGIFSTPYLILMPDPYLFYRIQALYC